MSGSAITMMVVGMLIIWGGLLVSIGNAVVHAKKAKAKAK